MTKNEDRINKLFKELVPETGKADSLAGDAKNAADLLRRIQKMKLLRKVALDRETEQKVRFKTTDCWGNISYLEIRK